MPLRYNRGYVKTAVENEICFLVGIGKSEVQVGESFQLQFIDSLKMASCKITDNFKGGVFCVYIRPVADLFGLAGS
jgi:hypothetical protein